MSFSLLVCARDVEAPFPETAGSCWENTLRSVHTHARRRARARTGTVKPLNSQMWLCSRLRVSAHQRQGERRAGSDAKAVNGTQISSTCSSLRTHHMCLCWKHIADLKGHLFHMYIDASFWIKFYSIWFFFLLHMVPANAPSQFLTSGICKHITWISQQTCKVVNSDQARFGEEWKAKCEQKCVFGPRLEVMRDV